MDESPLAAFAEWWRDEEVPALLATASPQGRPAVRAVELEAFGDDGFVFWTSAESPKGRDLAANPRAALAFVWGTRRQARVEGRVERVSDAEDERHWRDRRGKREIAAFRQSSPVESREALLALVARVTEDPPRPAFWVGYRVVPERVELCAYDAGFVHDRFEWVRRGDGWTRTRLQP